MTVHKWRFIRMLAISLGLLISISLVGITAQEEPIGEEAYQVVVQFYQYDKDIPLDARIAAEEDWLIERFEKLDYPVKSREKIVFTGGRGDRVPGYLGIPKAGSPPYPCVLTIHGGTNRKLSWWEDDSFNYGGLVTKELLSAGFALLALDAQGHGERIKNNDYESFRTIYGKYRNKLAANFIESVIDYRRAIDYLETRPEIDIDRIGVIGYSFGGSMTYNLTAVEPRIKVAVACVAPPYKEHTTWGAFHFASHIGARPFLLLYARLDKPDRVEGAPELLDLIDSPTKELVWYDSGHRLPPEYVNKAAEWFEEYLKQ